MKSLQLVAPFAERLNLNGDQANLFVLKKRLQWLGFSSEIIPVQNREQLEAANADFVFLGHGSLAAWDACFADWPTLGADLTALASKKVAMSVASGSDLLLRSATGSPGKIGHNVSKFEVETLSGERILGYKNSSQQDSETRLVGNILLTWLHGPVLAKNPQLADDIIARILADQAPKQFANENTRKIDEIVAGIWQLEAENL